MGQFRSHGGYFEVQIIQLEAQIGQLEAQAGQFIAQMGHFKELIYPHEAQMG